MLLAAMTTEKILDEKILAESGSFRRVRRWIPGWHPDEGQLTIGLTGKETIVEQDIVQPVTTVMVYPEDELLGQRIVTKNTS